MSDERAVTLLRSRLAAVRRAFDEHETGQGETASQLGRRAVERELATIIEMLGAVDDGRPPALGAGPREFDSPGPDPP